MTPLAATAEILRAIASTPREPARILDKIANTAQRLFAGAHVYIVRIEDGVFEQAAMAAPAGEPPAPPQLFGTPVDRGSVAGRAVLEKRIVHIEDIRRLASELPRASPKSRTAAAAPLLREGDAIGAIGIGRWKVEPFTAKELELLASFADQAVIAIENARLLRELRDSLDRRTAIAEVLQVISSSPGELQPVFETMLDNAVRLCEATSGSVFRVTGEMFHRVSSHNLPVELKDDSDVHYEPETPPMQMLATGRAVNVPDVLAELAEFDQRGIDMDKARIAANKSGARSVIWIPMVKDGVVVGAFVLNRNEVRAFTDAQIALVENFASQAVIAIENARLLAELNARMRDLSESLEQQTATSDVLRVIASSPDEPTHVLDIIANTAQRLFAANRSIITHIEGDVFSEVASGQASGRVMVDRLSETPVDHGSVSGRAALERRLVHVVDIRAVPDEYPRASGDVRTIVAAPLLRDGEAIGTIAVSRAEVKPFTDKEVGLLQSFADQAVIAIENARLLGELNARMRDLSESLEQQTATADVLRTIASSRGDADAALATILQTGSRLFGTNAIIIARVEGDVFGRIVTADSFGGEGDSIGREFSNRLPGTPIDRTTLMGRAVIEKRLIHVADIREMAHELPRANLEARTVVIAPLLHDGQAIGLIAMSRREIHPFTDKQLALLQSFADQAVIAIENARLLSELRDSLETQTASAEVLSAIASNPGDADRVLKTILRIASRLLGTKNILIARVEEYGFSEIIVMEGAQDIGHVMRQRLTGSHADLGTVIGRSVIEKRLIHVEDLHSRVAEFPRANLDSHTVLAVPLIREGQVIGVLATSRDEVRPFTITQIELVQSFADQAVIAIENARLLSELRESLERQTATAEILGAIAATPDEPQRALNAIAEAAARMFDAVSVAIRRRNGDALRSVAIAGPAAQAMTDTSPDVPFDRSHVMGECAVANRQICVDDWAREVQGGETVPVYTTQAYELGIRTSAFTPLARAGDVVGVMVVNRAETRPFTDSERDLMKGFADQAVIAIENARLLSELREALENQTATADILRTIASAPGDVRRALDMICETGLRMFGAAGFSIVRREGDHIRAVGAVGLAAEMIRDESPAVPLNENVLPGFAILNRCQVQIEDIENPVDELRRLIELRSEFLRRAGVRAVAATPLMREGEAIGAIVVHRAEVRRFTDKELQLLASFADQTVIAIENARLLDELRARTDELAQRQAELRVTFDNMGDGVVMFDEQFRLASWNRNLQQILDIPDTFFSEPKTYRDYVTYMIERGEFTPERAEELARLDDPALVGERFERTRPNGQILEVRRNPVPGGGFVLIFSDITERKRAEEHVRAARDAAERALSDLKLAQASLIQAEKMASLGQLTAGIAHEIKNPLNFVNNFAGLSVELLDELKANTAPAMAGLNADKRDEVEELIGMLTSNLEKVAEHGRRADGIVKSMLAHSRGSSGERQAVDLNALVEESLNLAYHGARAQDQNFNITMERDFDPSLGPIEVVPQELNRVFLNLFSNGFYAANKRQRAVGPSFQPTLRVSTQNGNSDVVIRIRDNGIGIPPEIRGKLFEPFFTTKPTGEGTGLGLSISYEIVTQQHGGTIEVESEPGVFTEFTVTLPKRIAPQAPTRH